MHRRGLLTPARLLSACGGLSLLEGKSLSLASYLDILSDTSSVNVRDSVRNGIKNNVYFVLNNTVNEERLSTGKCQTDP